MHLINIALVLLIYNVRTSSALCSEGCPPVDLEVGKSEHFKPPVLTYVLATSSSNPTKRYKEVSCISTYIARNQRLGPTGTTELESFRNKTSKEDNSRVLNFVFNKTSGLATYYNAHLDKVMDIKYQIIYMNPPYAVSYVCAPFNQSDPEKCFYSWSVFSTINQIRASKMKSITRELEKYKLDTNKENIAYYGKDNECK